MAEKKPERERKPEKIIPQIIEDEMKKSYLDYAMSVIVGRALPDIRDGLKPVHRRILYAMNDMGIVHSKPYKKCARIVGEVLGKYHPHGDVAVYDSLVRMAQSFSLRYPLVEGQGNFGSVDGDNAAAMRYTEARLAKISEEILQDIEKDTVKFVDNFDGSLQEPTVLPSKLPNLLINGSSGIAVGMATNIPPHNLNEVCSAIIKTIENPNVSLNELMQIIKGPDFPTGGTIIGKNGLYEMYSSGRGKIKVRAKIKKETEGNRENLIVEEIPYQINKSQLIEEIAQLVRDKKIKEINDIRDESDREGMRIVIELKKDADSNIVINQLYKHSRLQDTFGVIMLALVDNQPKVLALKQIIDFYIKHRIEIVKNRTMFDLKKSEERNHVLEGLVIALNDIDKIIQGIKASKTVNDAQNFLMKNYKITELQAKAILDLKLQKLSSLEQEGIRKEQKEILETIKKLKFILEHEAEVLRIIRNELEELKKYSDERRTVFSDEEEEIEIEDLIESQDMVITITHAGYIKRIPVDTYRQQKRGGKGITATGTKEEDFVEDLFIGNTHSYILFFTDKGKVYWQKIFQIPEASRIANGKAIINLIGTENSEKVTAFIPVKEFTPENYLILCTKNGTIKKSSLEDYSNPRRGGILAINLEEGDELINAVITDGTKELILATKEGKAVRFNEKDVRCVGRTSKGVTGVTLEENDEVIGLVVAEKNKTLLTITETGYGKRSDIEEYRLVRRASKGVINIRTSDRNGRVVAIKEVDDEDELMFISKDGILIRVAVKDISTIGRNTQGARLMKLKPGDKVVSAAKIIKEE
jgi:DNA gyrase subunit A